MTRKLLVIAVIVLAIGALLTSSSVAGNRQMKGKTAQQQVKRGNAGECPYGNTPQGPKAQGKAKGYGPGDGTGYGKGQKGDGTSTGPGICDGTGPKGKVNKGRVGKNNKQHTGRKAGRRGGRR